MHKYLFLFYFLTIGMINAQRARHEVKNLPERTVEKKDASEFITVNSPNYPESSFLIDQLIKNVLIKGITGCSGSVSNVRFSPYASIDFGIRSWAYFNKATANFPFDEGILLMTGSARYAGNSFSFRPLKGKLYTTGDVDLAKAIDVPNAFLYDATYIEFDFVPVTNRVSFSYIFASEEYGGYQCSYSDGFAFLIKKEGDQNYTNMAVLPNSNTPVNVVNIHGETEECAAENPQYYEGDNELEIGTNFAGRTVPLTAFATVIPGESYHFKMVVADFRDTEFDSGVFLKAGSFNIGLNLNDENGATLPDVINLCPGTSQVLSAGDQSPGSTYQWFLNGNLIPGATSSTITATQTGIYKLKVLLTNTICPLEVQVEINVSATPIITVTAPKTTICEGESITLTAMGGKIYTFTGLTGITNSRVVAPKTTTTYTVSGTSATGCQGNTASITIKVIPAIVSTLADVAFCKGSSAILDAGAGPNYTYLWNTGETTQKISVDKDGIYKVTISNGACSQVFSAVVSYIPVPIIEEILYEKNSLTVKVKDAQPNLEFSINKGINWQSSNVFTNILPNVNYSISVKSPGDFCAANVEFFTFFVNNIITPNADGFNDYADFSSFSIYKDFSVVIMDRYGKEVFRGNSTNAKWKANLRQSSASYWYQVSWEDPIMKKLVQKSGWILLKNRN